MGKKQRIERLERMLSGSNGEVQTYEPYKGVFADLEEHHSRLKAVEHDVPELIRTVERLVERVGALERDAAEVAARDITLTTEKFPFIASTADVEDVPGAGEVRSESHLWMHKGEIDAEVSRIEAEDAQPRQRASSPPSNEDRHSARYAKLADYFKEQADDLRETAEQLVRERDDALARIKELEEQAGFWEQSCREARAERNDLLDRRDFLTARVKELEAERDSWEQTARNQRDRAVRAEGDAKVAFIQRDQMQDGIRVAQSLSDSKIRPALSKLLAVKEGE